MRSWLVGALLLSLLGLGWVAWRVLQEPFGQTPRASLSVEEFMGTRAPEGFQRALTPREFRFPTDHGPHPGFRTEWWYVTGNLEGPAGEPYGFQFTIFRSALSPKDEGSGLPAQGTETANPGPGEKESDPTNSEATASRWRTNQLYMAHFAVTDGDGEKHWAFESFARGAQGLAGARAQPFRVWLGGWELVGARGSEDSDIFPLTLRGAQGPVALELALEPQKPLVLQGVDGLSQKGPEPGNASFYYSYTRLSAAGVLVREGDTLPVKGSAWMDREWSTSALSPGQVGWDWFALQLEDGHDLMYYQLRREDGAADSLSEGIWVDPAGRKEALHVSEVELEVLDRWVSGLDGAAYPSAWRLRVPSRDLSLEIRPLIPDQEMDLTFRYWEGAVRVTGTRGEVPLEGVGYVELTGYAGGEGEASRGRRMSRTGGG